MGRPWGHPAQEKTGRRDRRGRPLKARSPGKPVPDQKNRKFKIKLKKGSFHRIRRAGFGDKRSEQGQRVPFVPAPYLKAGAGTFQGGPSSETFPPPCPALFQPKPIRRFLPGSQPSGARKSCPAFTAAFSVSPLRIGQHCAFHQVPAEPAVSEILFLHKGHTDLPGPVPGIRR